MCGFEDIDSKGHFLAKKGFFQKSAWNISQTHQDVALCKKKSITNVRFSRYAVKEGRMDAHVESAKEMLILTYFR